METLQQHIKESLYSNHKDNSKFYKLCKQIPDDMWNPWDLVSTIKDEEKISGEFDYDEALADIESEIDDMFSEEEDEIRNLINWEKYEDLANALDKWDDPAQEYISATLTGFEDYIGAIDN